MTVADGRWVMTEDELNSCAIGYDSKKSFNMRSKENFRKHLKVDNRDGSAECRCAFCGTDHVQTGLGGFGEGFGYNSVLCRECGGTTDFVYKDEIGKFFK